MIYCAHFAWRKFNSHRFRSGGLVHCSQHRIENPNSIIKIKTKDVKWVRVCAPRRSEQWMVILFAVSGGHKIRKMLSHGPYSSTNGGARYGNELIFLESESPIAFNELLSLFLFSGGTYQIKVAPLNISLSSTTVRYSGSVESGAHSLLKSTQKKIKCFRYSPLWLRCRYLPLQIYLFLKYSFCATVFSTSVVSIYSCLKPTQRTVKKNMECFCVASISANGMKIWKIFYLLSRHRYWQCLLCARSTTMAHRALAAHAKQIIQSLSKIIIDAKRCENDIFKCLTLQLFDFGVAFVFCPRWQLSFENRRRWRIGHGGQPFILCAASCCRPKNHLWERQ